MRKPHLTLLAAALVAGPRVNDVVAVGIQKNTAPPGKGGRSIAVQSPWGNS